MALFERQRELFEFGSAMNAAFNDPKQLRKLKPKTPAGMIDDVKSRATGMLAIPKKRKRKRGPHDG